MHNLKSLLHLLLKNNCFFIPLMSFFELFLIYLTTASAIFLEGESALITASLASNIGYLNYPLVVICGFIATLTFDWVFFFTGRWKGQKLIENKRGLTRFKNRIDKFLHHYPNLTLFGYRYIYGFRGAICITIGLSAVKTRKYLIFSAITTLIWTGIYSGLGYFFGGILEKKLNDLQKSGPLVIILLVALGVLVMMIFAYYSRKILRK